MGGYSRMFEREEGYFYGPLVEIEIGTDFLFNVISDLAEKRFGFKDSEKIKEGYDYIVGEFSSVKSDDLLDEYFSVLGEDFDYDRFGLPRYITTEINAEISLIPGNVLYIELLDGADIDGEPSYDRINDHRYAELKNLFIEALDYSIINSVWGEV